MEGIFCALFKWKVTKNAWESGGEWAPGPFTKSAKIALSKLLAPAVAAPWDQISPLQKLRPGRMGAQTTAGSKHPQEPKAVDVPLPRAYGLPMKWDSHKSKKFRERQANMQEELLSLRGFQLSLRRSVQRLRDKCHLDGKLGNTNSSEKKNHFCREL